MGHVTITPADPHFTHTPQTSASPLQCFEALIPASFNAAIAACKNAIKAILDMEQWIATIYNCKQPYAIAQLAKHSAANDTHTVHAAEWLTTLTLSKIMWIKNSIKHVNNILSNSHHSVS